MCDDSYLAVGQRLKSLSLLHASMPGRDFCRFLTRRLVNAFVSKCNLLITPRLLPTDAGSLCLQLHTNNLLLTGFS
jgi:hypothetical protein